MHLERKILAVIPAYKVRNHILEVVSNCLDYVESVVVVDDSCPELSGKLVDENYTDDDRVSVIYHESNTGVGGAVKSGFEWALENDFFAAVKVDGDGQMPASLIPSLIAPLVSGQADYCKGNRFHSPQSLRSMPASRIVGNAGLSLLNKVSSGYWSLNDPTNGFIAISSEMLRQIELGKLADDYFFESDLLYRLAISRARVAEMNMAARYGDEQSNLSIAKTLFTFPFFHLRNFAKRIFYQYYVREWSIGSIQLPTGLLLLIGGVWFGLATFNQRRENGLEVTAGESVATAIAVILGFQLLLSFLAEDIQNEPKNFR